MAKYDVECPQCGTSYTVQLYGPGKDRQWKLDNWDWTCDDCKENARQQKNAEAAKANAESGLPPLTGSEKQIAWAETIRKQKIATVEEEINKMPGEKKGQSVYPRLMAAVQKIRERTSSHWWIENREMHIRLLIEEEFKNTETPLPPEEQNIAKQAEAEAKIEATVRPESPVTETVAEITVKEDIVEIHFPEKREDFRELVRFKLGYSWDKNKTAWSRRIGIKTGSSQDRAAEAGNKLLAAGFPIRIFDADIRARAINGQYEPECHRWIMKRTANQYTGWFSISWPRGEDFFRAAKKLPGSKYDKPDIVVPAEQFEQVLDFAEMYEFNLSPGAQELAEIARKLRDSVLTAKVEIRDDAVMPEPGKRPRKLDIPEKVEVSGEFKEEML